jgi:histidinol-phosphatase (PHP family)
MIFADYHVHSNFSKDASRSADMETMVKRAIKLGLRELAITDHRDYAETGLLGYHSADFEANMTELLRLREKYTAHSILLLGVEIGICPSQARVIEAFVAKYPIDFVIGSSHDPPAGTAYYYTDYFKGKTKRDAYAEYFRHTIDNIRSTDGFDVFGHVDYIFRYSSLFGAYPDNSLNYHDYSDAIDEILKELISRGKGIEINTSGYKYGLETIHPQPDILKRYRELGGEIITIGSDAHAPGEIKNGFDKAEAILKECGFTAYTLFRGRKPVWEKF